MNRKTDDGFGLIEVTLVLLLVGLLMNFAFKSAPALESAQLRSVVRGVQTYRVATQLFRERYGYLPGDYPYAQRIIHPDLRNGNGNGIIEGAGMSYDSEAYWFWQHLGSAGLIAHPGRVPPHQKIAFNHGVPGSKAGGGFTVVSHPPGREKSSGPWLRLGQQNGDKNNRALLTPLQVKYILDLCGEGDPFHGSVVAWAGEEVPPSECVRAGRLNMKTSYPACVVYFKL